jgi:hypothetical protein
MYQVSGPLGAFGTSSIQPRRVTVFDDGLASNVHAIISIMSAEDPATTPQLSDHQLQYYHCEEFPREYPYGILHQIRGYGSWQDF